MNNLLQNLLSTDNNVRTQAENELGRWKDASPEQACFELMRLMANSGIDLNLRQSAAILLRRLLIQERDFFGKLSETA